MSLKKRDYYTVLGVSQRAKPQEIKKAYHEGVMQHHPDKNPGNKLSEILYIEINEAYSTLKDPEKRAEYDYSMQLETNAPQDLPVKTLETLFGKVDSEDKGAWISGFNTHLMGDKQKKLLSLDKILVAFIAIAMVYLIHHFLFSASGPAAVACNTPRAASISFLGTTYHTSFTKEEDSRWSAPVMLDKDLADTIHLSTNYVKIIANFTGDAPANGASYPYIEEQVLSNPPTRTKADMDIHLEWNCNGQKQSESYNFKAN